MNLIRTWLQKLQNENFQRNNVKYGKRGTKSCQTAALDIYILIGERRFKSMEMQNVIAQLSISETFSDSISNNFATASQRFSSKNENFEKMMSERIQGNNQKNTKDLTSAGSTRTVSDKRQTEMLHSSNDTNTKQECKEVERNQSLQSEQAPLENVDEMKQNQEVVSTWNEDVKQQICKELDITPEELEGIMSQLGLQLADLQNLSNLQQLVLTASGESDTMLLLTDESLGSKLQNLMEDISHITKNVQEQFDISEQEFSERMKNHDVVMDVSENDTINIFSKTSDDKDINQQQSTLLMEVDTQVQTTKTEVKTEENLKAEENLKTTQLISDVDTLDNETLQTDDNRLELEREAFDNDVKNVKEILVSTEQNEVEKEVVSVTDAEPLIVDNKEAKMDKETTVDEVSIEVSVEDVEFSHLAEKKDSQFDGGNNQSMFEQFMSHLTAEKVNMTEDVSMKATVVEQMREIVNQVVEQIKVTVKPDTSAMEIQLNPENLGKVNLSVVAKEGHITAQFVTETEMAKHALEGQLQQLRETLGEQGLKVDEVEVTVSNFDFSQSSQANAEEQKQQQQSSFSKKIVRNLNINDMDNLEELTEEEQLAAKIMQLNGNQVDYTA